MQQGEWIQYKAIFDTDNGAYSPILSKVEIIVERHEVEKLIKSTFSQYAQKEITLQRMDSSRPRPYYVRSYAWSLAIALIETGRL